MKAPRATYEVDGAAIRKIRMSRGIPIADLARSAGISRSYLCRLEIGARKRMRPETYARLLAGFESLGVPLEAQQLLALGETDSE
ncbi:helix-turn-helix domain-containing protein [Streptomyces sp. NPDC056485]|uniref:helix-turn-helix domain-containing protein n=1 Tax=Streptomyces sp. NPDC056485 TaxID=3345834 RepID=UPI0036B37DEC